MSSRDVAVCSSFVPLYFKHYNHKTFTSVLMYLSVVHQLSCLSKGFTNILFNYIYARTMLNTKQIFVLKRFHTIHLPHPSPTLLLPPAHHSFPARSLINENAPFYLFASKSQTIICDFSNFSAETFFGPILS